MVLSFRRNFTPWNSIDVIKHDGTFEAELKACHLMRQPWAQGGQGHNVGVWMWNVSNRLKWLNIWCQREMGPGLIVHFYFLYLPECIWNVPQFCFNVFPINPSLSCSLSGIWYQRWEKQNNNNNNEHWACHGSFPSWNQSNCDYYRRPSENRASYSFS